jgi:hypothetical protein
LAIPCRPCDSRNLALSPLCALTGLQSVPWLEDAKATYTSSGEATPGFLAGRQGRTRQLFAYQHDKSMELLKLTVSYSTTRQGS